jgi:AraC-like DNA-binding protein
MLESFPEHRSCDISEIEAALRANAYGDRVDLPGGRPRHELIANAARFNDAALVFSAYDGPIAFGFKAASCIRLIYQVRKVSEVTMDGSVIENASSAAGYLIPTDRPWSVRHTTGYHNLSLRVPSETLQRKLSALLGANREQLDLRQPSAADGRSARLVREAVFNFAKQLEVADPRFRPLLVESSVDDICLSMLTGLSEQVLEAAREPAAPSNLQLGRVEQYIVANFTRPLSVETLAEISGVSALSVYRHFRSRYGCTPNEYLGKIRLEMAHVRLLSCPDENAVMSVALQLGFPSFSQFEQAYRKRFGERPSPMARI